MCSNEEMFVSTSASSSAPPPLLQRAVATVKVTASRNQYRLAFVSYSLVVTVSSSILLYILLQLFGCSDGSSTSLFQTLFIAISSFTCTGLYTADVAVWNAGAQLMVILTVELGSLPLCAAMPSILRARSLRKLDASSLPQHERGVIHRHYAVSIAVVWVCVAYWFLVQLVAFILLVGEMGPWWSIFHVGAGFNNAGFALDSRSFAYPELAGNTYVVLVFILLMPMGNTLFPVALRHTVHAWEFLLGTFCSMSPGNRGVQRWIFLGLSPKELANAMRELLHCPQEYFTHLFSREQSWYLLAMWIVLTTVDYLMFIPEYGSSAFVTDKNEWLQALFQTVTVRTTGFTIMNLMKVQLGHISYWMISMYLSSYPFMISQAAARKLLLVGSTAQNHFDQLEESPRHPREGAVAMESNGDYDAGSRPPTANKQFKLESADVAKHLQEFKSEADSTVATEIGWLFLAAIVISYAENVDLSSTVDPSAFTRILFEVVSAYGTVGLSLALEAYPTVSYSGAVSMLSQCVIIIVMYFGKFRGLPPTVEVEQVQELIERHKKGHKSGDLSVVSEQGDANHHTDQKRQDVPAVLAGASMNDPSPAAPSSGIPEIVDSGNDSGIPEPSGGPVEQQPAT